MARPIQKTTIILLGLTFFWFTVTVLSALLYSRSFLPASWRETVSPLLHPQWATATIFLMIPLQLWWIRKLTGNETDIRDMSARRYVMIFLLITAALTGFATTMGFLPFFFHELSVWPLVGFVLWDLVQSLSRR